VAAFKDFKFDSAPPPKPTAATPPPAAAAAPVAPPPPPPTPPSPVAVAPPPPAFSSAAFGGATPYAKSLAAERGIDIRVGVFSSLYHYDEFTTRVLQSVRGSGPDGRVLAADVGSAGAQTPSKPGPSPTTAGFAAPARAAGSARFEDIELSNVRKVRRVHCNTKPIMYPL